MANYNSNRQYQNNGGYQQPQQGGYNQQQGYQQPQPQQPQQPQQNSGHNQQQGGFERFNSLAIIRRGGHMEGDTFVPNPLETAFMSVLVRPGDRGDNPSINYMVSKAGKPMIRLNFNLKLSQYEVERNFGPEFVRADGTVDFTVFLQNRDVDFMMSHPPKATQSILLLIGNMKTNEYTDRNGVKRLSIVGNGYGFQRVGTTKKKDGTDASAMIIFGAEKANQQPQQGGYQQPQQGGFQPQNGYQAPQQGSYQPAPAQDSGPAWEEFDGDDDDLPF